VRRLDARLRIVTIDAGRQPVQVRIRVDDNNHFVDLIASSAAHNPIQKTRGSSRIVLVRTIHEVDPVFQTLWMAVSKRLRRVVADGETIRTGSEPLGCQNGYFLSNPSCFVPIGTGELQRDGGNSKRHD
jgi:hypothetical protein